MMRWISIWTICVVFVSSCTLFGGRDDDAVTESDLVIEACGLVSTHGRHYRNELNLEAYYEPVKAVYELGDTLWFTYIARDSVYDENFDRKFYLPDFPYQCKVDVIGSDRSRDVINMEIMFSLSPYIDEGAQPNISVQTSEADGYWHYPYRMADDHDYSVTSGYIVLRLRGFFLIRSKDNVNSTDRLDSPDHPRWYYEWDCRVSKDYLSIYTRTQHEDNLEEYKGEIQYIMEEKFPRGYRAAGTLDGEIIALRQEGAFAFEVR